MGQSLQAVLDRAESTLADPASSAKLKASVRQQYTYAFVRFLDAARAAALAFEKELRIFRSNCGSRRKT